MASRLTNEKQVVWACEALQPVVEKNPELGIVILGDGPERGALEKISYVRVAGWTENVVAYMKGADVFLNTSLYEGYGRTLVESTAAGTPIITTDVGVAREVVVEGKNGFIINVGDAAKMISHISEIIENKVTMIPHIPQMQTNQEYLKNYLIAWQQCFEG